MPDHSPDTLQYPEQVWAELARLAGSMLTFSLEHDLDAIPDYDHQEQGNAFPPLFELITGLLEASQPECETAGDDGKPLPEMWYSAPAALKAAGKSVQQEDRCQTQEDKKSAGIGQGGNQYAGANGGIALEFGHNQWDKDAHQRRQQQI